MAIELLTLEAAKTIIEERNAQVTELKKRLFTMTRTAVELHLFLCEMVNENDIDPLHSYAMVEFKGKLGMKEKKLNLAITLVSAEAHISKEAELFIKGDDDAKS